MADIRTLKKSFLREAATCGRVTVEAQLNWLESKRAACQQEVDAGDWEITGASRAGRSSSASRKITATDRLKAIMAAMESLETADSGSTGDLLSFRIHGIQS